ncbi:transcriptional repressor [Lagierella sp.]|uniref:Fur family transcriptional regulator n=1 Tax=Lagierella sp. TaxID=2849657 RepID=UPI00260D840C|nr:transcriptional repressor [Lagierella sp.]
MDNMILLDNFKKELVKSDIRPTFQRIKILEYLEKNKSHPTVDEIYSALAPEIPTLSKTTVYNTLSTLKEAGLVNEIKIDDVEARFDIVTKPHGHFKCVECGDLSDFEFDLGSINPKELSDHKVLNRNLFMFGICPKCLEKMKENKIDNK